MGHAVVSVIFCLTGLGALACSVVTVWKLMPHTVVKLTGRRPPRFGLGSGGASFGGFVDGGGGGGCGGDGGGGGSC